MSPKCKIFIICAVALMCACEHGYTSEPLRIAGMGGVFSAVYNTEASIFGNPAGLTVVEANNVSAAFSAQNLDYESLPINNGTEQGTGPQVITAAQLNEKVSFRLSPSMQYSRAIGKFGVAFGYFYDLDNRESTLRVDKTTAVYIVDERKFIADTNTILKYDLYRESVPVLSIGYAVKPDLAVGIRLKYRQQTYKKGVITRPVELTAVHDPDVNRNDATKLLPAIMNNLDIGKTIEDYKNGVGSVDEVEIDSSGRGLDFDFGIQAKLYDKGNVCLGFMLDHLIQRKVAFAQPSEIRIGLGAIPLEWLNAGVDFRKSLSKKGLEMNLGWEVHYEWQKGFSGGVIFRNGFSRESSENNLSLGIGLRLGGSVWEYALVKTLDSSPISKANHLLSSTTRF